MILRWAKKRYARWLESRARKLILDGLRSTDQADMWAARATEFDRHVRQGSPYPERRVLYGNIAGQSADYRFIPLLRGGEPIDGAAVLYGPAADEEGVRLGRVEGERTSRGSK